MSRSKQGGVAALVVLAGLAVARGGEEHDPSGEWKITTTGTKAGRVTIAPAERGARRFELRWNTPKGDWQGIGLLRAGHLYCSWGQGANGVMVWKKEGPGWTAEWIHKTQSEERLGAETIRGERLAGKHSVEGTHPNGNAYTGEVEIERTGDVFKLTWKVGDLTYHGVGIEAGTDRLAVAYGRDEFGVMDYDLSGGDEISGRWAGRADHGLSTETLKRKR